MTQAIGVAAMVTDCYTGAERYVLVDLTYDGRAVRMRGGPTGYESFLWSDWRLDRDDWTWVACAGTPGRWDGCTVSDASMRDALRELGLTSG